MKFKYYLNQLNTIQQSQFHKELLQQIITSLQIQQKVSIWYKNKRKIKGGMITRSKEVNFNKLGPLNHRLGYCFSKEDQDYLDLILQRYLGNKVQRKLQYYYDWQQIKTENEFRRKFMLVIYQFVDRIKLLEQSIKPNLRGCICNCRNQLDKVNTKYQYLKNYILGQSLSNFEFNSVKGQRDIQHAISMFEVKLSPYNDSQKLKQQLQIERIKSKSFQEILQYIETPSFCIRPKNQLKKIQALSQTLEQKIDKYISKMNENSDLLKINEYYDKVVSSINHQTNHENPYLTNAETIHPYIKYVNFSTSTSKDAYSTATTNLNILITQIKKIKNKGLSTSDIKYNQQKEAEMKKIQQSQRCKTTERLLKSFSAIIQQNFQQQKVNFLTKDILDTLVDKKNSKDVNDYILSIIQYGQKVRAENQFRQKLSKISINKAPLIDQAYNAITQSKESYKTQFTQLFRKQLIFRILQNPKSDSLSKNVPNLMWIEQLIDKYQNQIGPSVYKSLQALRSSKQVFIQNPTISTNNNSILLDNNQHSQIDLQELKLKKLQDELVQMKQKVLAFVLNIPNQLRKFVKDPYFNNDYNITQKSMSEFLKSIDSKVQQLTNIMLTQRDKGKFKNPNNEAWQVDWSKSQTGKYKQEENRDRIQFKAETNTVQILNVKYSIVQLKDKYLVLNATNKNLSQQNDSLKLKNTQIEAQLQKQTNMENYYKEELKKKQKVIYEKCFQISKLKQSNKNTTEQLEKISQSLEKQVSDFKWKIGILQQKNKRIPQLDALADELKRKNSDYQNILPTKQEKIKDYQSQLDKIQTQLQTRTNNIKQLNQTMLQKQKLIKELQSKLTDLQSKNKELLQQKQKKMPQQKNRKAAFRSMNINQNSQSQLLNSKIKELQKKIKALESSNSELKQQIDKRNQQIQRLLQQASKKQSNVLPVQNSAQIIQNYLKSIQKTDQQCQVQLKIQADSNLLGGQRQQTKMIIPETNNDSVLKQAQKHQSNQEGKQPAVQSCIFEKTDEQERQNILGLSRKNSQSFQQLNQQQPAGDLKQQNKQSKSQVQKIETIQSLKDELQKKIQTIQQQERTINQIKQKAQQQEQTLNSQINDMLKQIQESRRENGSLKIQISSRNAIMETTKSLRLDQLNSLRAQLLQQQTFTKSLQEQLSQIKHEHSQLQAQNNTLNEQIKQHQLKLPNIQTKKQATLNQSTENETSRFQQQNKNVDTIKNQTTNNSVESKQLEKKLKESEEKVKKAQELMKDWKVKAVGYQMDLIDEKQQHKDLRDKYKKQISQYKEKVEQINKLQNDYKSQIETLTKQLNEMKASSQSFEITLQNTRSKSYEMQSLVMEKDKTIDQMTQKMNRLQNYIQALSKTLSERQAQIRQQSQSLKSMRKANSAEIQKLKKESAEQIKKLKLQNSRKIQEKESEISQMKMQQRINSIPSSSGQSERFGSSDPSSQLKLELGKISGQLEKAKKLLNERENQLTQLKSQRQSLFKQLKKNKEEIQNLNSQVTALQNEAQQYRFSQSLNSSRINIEESNTNKNVVYDRFFAGEALDQQYDRKYNLFNLLKSKNSGLTVKKTRLLYRFDQLNPTNFHSYVDKIPNILIIVRTIKGHVFGAFSSAKYEQKSKQSPYTVSFLFTFKSDKLESFDINYSRNNAKSLTYDDYFLIVGNSQIRLRFGEKSVYSNFGINNGYYDTRGIANVNDLLDANDARQIQIATFEVFEVQFEKR